MPLRVGLYAAIFFAEGAKKDFRCHHSRAFRIRSGSASKNHIMRFYSVRGMNQKERLLFF